MVLAGFFSCGVNDFSHHRIRVKNNFSEMETLQRRGHSSADGGDQHVARGEEVASWER